MFAKRHYEATVRALALAHDHCDSLGATRAEVRNQRIGVDKAAQAMANLFASDNGRFDRDRFADAYQSHKRSV